MGEACQGRIAHGEVRRGGPQPTLLSKEAASEPGAAFPLQARGNPWFPREPPPPQRPHAGPFQEPATAALAEGRNELARARAALEGRDAPERRPPCFFDPRHGPAEREVEWASRVVAACEADAALDAFCDEWNRGNGAGARFEMEYLVTVGTRAD